MSMCGKMLTLDGDILTLDSTSGSQDGSDPQGGEPLRSWSVSTAASCKEADAQTDNFSLHARQPKPLNSLFDPRDVKQWDSGRFALVRKIQDASRNQGHVYQMIDMTTGGNVAVKRMPNAWVCKSHAGFREMHPHDTEQPWVDIGCTAFLNSLGYPYACPLVGVFRDPKATYVLSELASDGDIFELIAACPEEPGLQWEGLAKPIAMQAMDAVRHLHNLSIVHRDISAENILLTRRPDNGALRLQLIDFAMATTERFARGRRFGKPAYQAPEVHADEAVDGFLSDAYSVGVVLYCLMVKEFPWQSTQPGACKIFGFFRRQGFREFARRRKRRRREATILESLSEPLVQLLEGLLAAEPGARLTLGEVAAFEPDRKSVWLEPWVQDDQGDHRCG